MKTTWKHLLFLTIASLVLGSGCISEPDLDSGEFICDSDADCVSGYRCDGARGICVQRSGGGTTKTFCEENFFVEGRACVECDKGFINAAGDDPEGADTACEARVCGTNQRVENFDCVPCAAGEVNASGDLATDGTTACDKIACEADQYVKNNTCTECPAGTRRPPGDDPSGGDTECVSTFCEENQRVLQGACEPCPRGTTNAAGDNYTGEDTSCDPIICMEDERVFDYACTPCRPGSANEAGDLATSAYTECTVTLCEENFFVEDNACRECVVGSTRPAGDDPTGSDTQCEAVICKKDERVFQNTCVPCSPGTSSPGGDRAAGQDTYCEVAYCSANERVFENTCVGCTANESNLPEDDPTGPDTTCDGTTLCASNYHVVDGSCRLCPANQLNYAGDDPTGENTECDGINCPANFRVEAGRCVACDPGYTNEEGDDSAGEDSDCDAIICQVNEYVSNFACVACPPGTTNPDRNDATQGDTECIATLCGANQRVSNNTCVMCPPGTTNDAGDDASSADTECDPIYCERYERVVANTCVPCPSGSANGKGDDASGTDTVCDGILGLAAGGPCVILEGDAFQWVSDGKLQASDPQQGQRFGTSVAVHGNFAVIGAPEDDDSASASGAAYLFERSTSGTWIQRHKFKASAPTSSDRFGSKVLMAEDLILVSASLSRGKVHVLTRNPQGTWIESQVLSASDMAGFGFGKDMALDGSELVIIDISGNAYRFQQNAAGAWIEVQKESIGTGSTSVAIDGTTVALGWTGHGGSKGAVQIDGQLLEGTTSSAMFAASVALKGDILAVGSPDHHPFSGVDRTGKVFLYAKGVNGSWSAAGSIDPPNKAKDLHFGRQVRFSDRGLLIADEDRVYRYESTPQGTWELQQTEVSKVSSGRVTMASKGSLMVIGVPNGDGADENIGTVRVFERRNMLPGSPEHRAAGGLLACPTDPSLTTTAGTDLGIGTDIASLRGIKEVDRADSNSPSWGCALGVDGRVVCWGEGSYGQIRNSKEDSDVPVLTLPESDAQLEMMSLGRSHTCGITSLSQVYCWGASQYNTASSTSGLISGIGSVQDIVSVDERTCALSSGSIQCWKGSSGNGAVSLTSAPVSKLAERGGRFGVLNDDTVISWAAEATTTQAVTGLTGVASVVGSVSGSHNCALTLGGHVWCWGENSDGQLGIGSSQDSQTPVQANGIGDVIEVGASGDSTCAVIEDASSTRSLSCWGQVTGTRVPTTVDF